MVWKIKMGDQRHQSNIFCTKYLVLYFNVSCTKHCDNITCNGECGTGSWLVAWPMGGQAEVATYKDNQNAVSICFTIVHDKRR